MALKNSGRLPHVVVCVQTREWVFAFNSRYGVPGWLPHAATLVARPPRTLSPSGKVNDGDRVTLAPVDPAMLKVGDIVLVRVRGSDYLHLIKAIDRSRFLIGNNRGGINGWVGPHAIYGIATRIES